ncbi:uncharacterized protein LOC107616147 [Arachis ipaensis]|uniref:uncharacterized protein LOC107616147 n=1 Tax=Arachis ipaensis TaxID=130454 RepID=UPI0007AFB486|nr:uncharacterized protein LOC107616147 [Arachis ipaensis]
MIKEAELIKNFRDMNLQVTLAPKSIRLNHLTVTSQFKEQITKAQSSDPDFQETLSLVKEGKLKGFIEGEDKVWRYQGRICVPKEGDLQSKIAEEAHKRDFTIHPGMTKMYHDLKKMFWWPGMKRDLATIVNKCLVCQKVKIEHQKPSGVLQPLGIPEWKWEDISMDFVMGLPRTQTGRDAIWVIVDRLTKTAHFLPVKATDSLERLATLYIKEIVRPGKWESHLPLIEFAYNNSYRGRIGMAPYEALYGRRCQSPLCWYGPEDKGYLGPELVLTPFPFPILSPEEHGTADRDDAVPLRVTSEYDPSKHAWVVATTTTVLQTIYLGRELVEEEPQLPVITFLDRDASTSRKRSSKVVHLESDPETEEEKSDNPGQKEDTMEEDPEEKLNPGGSPKVEYVPYSPISAPRRVLVHPTQRNRVFTARKGVGGRPLVPRFINN